MGFFLFGQMTFLRHFDLFPMETGIKKIFFFMKKRYGLERLLFPFCTQKSISNFTSDIDRFLFVFFISR